MLEPEVVGWCWWTKRDLDNVIFVYSNILRSMKACARVCVRAFILQNCKECCNPEFFFHLIFLFVSLFCQNFGIFVWSVSEKSGGRCSARARISFQYCVELETHELGHNLTVNIIENYAEDGASRMWLPRSHQNRECMTMLTEKLAKKLMPAEAKTHRNGGRQAQLNK